MSRRTKKTKLKPVLSQEFQDARLWYKMEVANYSFELVRNVLRSIREGNHSERSPEYYMIMVGLICIYARPFTYNEPVGKLSDEIVPEEFKKLHDDILEKRHTIFAHAEVSVLIGEEDYPNEVVIESDGKNPSISVGRVAVTPDGLERMSPLVEALIEKTNYHRLKYAKKFNKTVLNLGKGEFRLNVVDSSAPIFLKLSKAQKLVWQKKKNSLDPKSTA
jgi:hypothetical protein